MKIIQVLPAFTDDRGGVETHVRSISHEFKKAGHQVDIFAMDDVVNGSKDNRAEALNKLKVWGRVWANLARFDTADVVIVHDVMWWLLPIYPFILGNVLITFHGWEGDYPIPWRYKLHRWLMSKLAAGTIHVGKWIQEFYWDKPNLITYGGVNAKSKSKARSKKSHKSNLKIVFLGRLEAENDIKRYIQLFKSLKSDQQFKNINITWVGDGAYKKQCQKLGKVTGMVENIDKYIASADLVWSASYLSILKAQAAGKLVCALYSHRLKQRYLETYPGAKYLIMGESLEKVGAELKKLSLSPAQKSKIEKQARKWANQQTWQKVASTYQKLWKAKL